MSGTERSSDGLDVRRRKLLFRAWHRGMREMDFILGRFADRTLAGLTDAELVEFERLIDVPDRDLLAWITGELDTPAEHNGPLFRRLLAFQLSGEGAR
jgi:antitoxin CptB